ncbi:MAG TPA: biotin carboxylase N-terminal domain-containing protein, partial [Candidatus Nitrosocosmicus sp.]|nr:biotin carboxylase N-terminal domain-containing protein [Candidatus Nitrosocosmicus sp.]
MERILIANRGEIVIRVAKTCRKLGYSPCGIYADADKNSLHIKHCDRVENIGGNLPNESYLNMMKIIDAARKMDCTFIHPGYGFLAEKSEFADLCNKEELIFVGPSADVLKISGDKVLAKEVLSNVVTTIKGKEVSDINEALEFAEELGYPVIIKAARGGGGRGLQIIDTPQQLTKLLKFSI